MLAKFDHGLVVANRFVAGTLLAIMALLVFANVVLRYLFGFSLSWVEEVTRYMMIWLAWLAAGLALREGAHIAIDSLQAALPRHIARVVRLVVVLCILGFFAALVWLGLQYALFAWNQTTAVLRLSLGAIYLAIPLGSLLMIAHLLLIAADLVNRDLTPEEVAQNAEMSVL